MVKIEVNTIPIDPEFLKEYDRQMREEVIPAIIEEIKANARRVVEIRHIPLF